MQKKPPILSKSSHGTWSNGMLKKPQLSWNPLFPLVFPVFSVQTGFRNAANIRVLIHPFFPFCPHSVSAVSTVNP